MRFSRLISVLLFLSISSMSFGQATANFTASVTVIQPIGITTTSDMDFANLDASSGGAVVLTPESTRMTTGGVRLKDSGNVSAARFEITGQSGLAFSVTLPQNQYVLSNGRESIIIRDFTSSYNSSGILAENTQILKVGATIDVPPNQTPGRYSNQTPLSVTVNYN